MPPIGVRIGDAHVRFTSRSEGDLGTGAAGASDEVERRRRAVLDRPWSWARQVHGAGVVVVSGPVGDTQAAADVLVTALPGVGLAVFTADCAPIAMVGDTDGGGVIAAVHAGWRGLVNGVVDAAAGALRDHGATTLRAALGPSIHPECYAFSPPDLDAVARRLGEAVRAVTSAGDPALDVPAAVRASLDRAGVALEYESDLCTACSPDLFSHRARAEPERQAMVIWRD